jgi:hypothetical protein
VIRRGRLRGREGLWDLAVAGDRIAAVAPTIAEPGREELDAAGGLVTPTFVNPHVHLDKTMLGDVMRPNVSQTLQEAIAITWEFKRAYTDDEIVRRAGPAVEAAVAYGTTVLRAFADVDSVGGLRAVRGLLALRERYRGVADIQVVAFPQEGIVRDPGTDRLPAAPGLWHPAGRPRRPERLAGSEREGDPAVAAAAGLRVEGRAGPDQLDLAGASPLDRLGVGAAAAAHLTAGRAAARAARRTRSGGSAGGSAGGSHPAESGSAARGAGRGDGGSAGPGGPAEAQRVQEC